MADFEITSPEGKKFIVSAPEGATQEQVLSYAQGQFGSQPEPDSPFVKGAKLGMKSASDVMLAPLILGMKSNELLDKAAYEAGGKITDITGSPEAGGLTNMAVQAVPMALTGAKKIGLF